MDDHLTAPPLDAALTTAPLEAVQALVFAVRAQSVAVQALADVIANALEPAPPQEPAADGQNLPPCNHPDEARKPFPSMGHPGRWICSPAAGGCGYIYDPSQAHGDAAAG